MRSGIFIFNLIISLKSPKYRKTTMFHCFQFFFVAPIKENWKRELCWYFIITKLFSNSRGLRQLC